MGRIHPDLSYCSLLLSCKGEDTRRKREERKGREGEGKNAGRKEEKKKRRAKSNSESEKMLLKLYQKTSHGIKYFC